MTKVQEILKCPYRRVWCWTFRKISRGHFPRNQYLNPWSAVGWRRLKSHEIIGTVRIFSECFLMFYNIIWICQNYGRNVCSDWPKMVWYDEFEKRICGFNLFDILSAVQIWTDGKMTHRKAIIFNNVCNHANECPCSGIGSIILLGMD